MKKRIYLYFALAILGLALCFASILPRSLSAREIGDRGWQFYQNEEYAKAVEVWQAEISRAPEPQQQALLAVRLCLAYQHLGRWPEAQDAIARAFQLLDSAPENSRLRAQALNALGRLHWAQGRAQPALETWQQAQQQYEAAGDGQGAIGTQLNQAKALQALGFSVRASDRVAAVTQQLQEQPPSPLQAQAYLALGETQRRLGELAKAEDALTAGWKVAQTLRMDAMEGKLALELGNVARSRADREIAIGETKAALNSLESAIQHYQQAANSPSAIARLQAYLNQLGLAADTGNPPDATLLPQIEALFAQLPLTRTTIAARLNYARSLACWQDKIDAEIPACTRSEWRDYWQEKQQPEAAIGDRENSIYRLLSEAIRASETLQDSRLELLARAQLGAFYEQQHQWQKAEAIARQIAIATTASDADELAYRARWQLGRLLVKQNQPEVALQAYADAVESLEGTRQNLLTINTDVRFSFRDNVEPVYREYVELLLRTDEKIKPSQDNLKSATEAIDQLQLAAIENFLRCNLDSTVKKVNVDTIADPHAAIIYPIATRRGIALVFKIGTGDWDYRFSEVAPRDRQTDITNLRTSLSEDGGGKIAEIQEASQRVYRWLFQPIEAVLEKNTDLETLVFVLDDPFRILPMGVLYDGERYLIQKKYAIAIAPSLKIFPPHPPASQLTFFSGGVGWEQKAKDFIDETFSKSFREIEELELELENIPEPNSTLINDRFTKKNIKEELKERSITAIHWKTHGVFSSNPEETYLVAYRQLIRARELNQLITVGTKAQAQPLELLVLSACSAAEGDKRAVLGLTGVAARSGARTTLSTLWRANDVFNTKLTQKFYENLQKPRMTKAKALHLAQQEFAGGGWNNPDPHFWANYILVGNWL